MVEAGLKLVWSQAREAGFLDAADLRRVVRKPAFCICENKGADQLHGNRTADQHLCFAT